MTNGPDSITPSAAEDLAAIAPTEDVVTSTGMSTRTKVGVLATAVVVGAIGVMTIQGSSSASPSASQGPGGFAGGPPGGQGFQGPGGFGSQGTVASISASSITVTTASGTVTATITSATQVIVNGQPGSVSDITKGATVMVHKEGDTAERVFVETMGFGGPPGGGFGPPPGQQQGTGTTSTT